MTKASRFIAAWNDLPPTAIGTRTGPSAAAYTQFGTTGIFLPMFSDNHGADEIYQATFQMSHGWQEGSALHPHVHVIPTANGAGGNEDVVLKLDYQFINIGAAFSTTTNSSETLVFRVGAAEANKHIMWEWSAITATGKTLSAALPLLITRLSKTDVRDNYTGSIYLLFCDLHNLQDGLGSIGELTK